MIIKPGQVYTDKNAYFKIIDVIGNMIRYISKHRYEEASWDVNVQVISAEIMADYFKSGCLKLMNEPVITGCQHEFKPYTGLRETYNYCVKCDHKESQAV